MHVKPLRPSNTPAVSIVETDVQLDFAAPLDYQEKKVTAMPSSTAQPIPMSDKRSKMEESDEDENEDEDNTKKFKAFTGTAYTLKSPSGKSPAKSPATITPSPKVSVSPVYKAAASKESVGRVVM